jgi:hypothetical protein
MASALSREGEEGRLEKAGFRSRSSGPEARSLVSRTSPGLDGSGFLVTN